MKRRVGVVDQGIRIIVAIAAVIVSLVIGTSTAWGIVLLVLAMLLLVTGLSGFCPVYSVLKIETVSKTKESDKGHRVVHRPEGDRPWI